MRHRSCETLTSLSSPSKQRLAPCFGRSARQIFPRGLKVKMCLGALLLSFHANAAPSVENRGELKVTLFGQPCVLQGPVDQRTLKAIHSLSPEQLYPQRGVDLASEPTRRAVEKLRNTSVPSNLDRYRERLIRRLDAQLAFLQSVEGFQKARKAEAVLTVGKKFLPSKRLKDFEALLKKAEAIKELRSDRGREVLDTLFDSYSDWIEADPEEEFHRAIQRMKVQYTCSFEESGGSDEGEDPESHSE